MQRPTLLEIVRRIFSRFFSFSRRISAIGILMEIRSCEWPTTTFQDRLAERLDNYFEDWVAWNNVRKSSERNILIKRIWLKKFVRCFVEVVNEMLYTKAFLISKGIIIYCTSVDFVKLWEEMVLFWTIETAKDISDLIIRYIFFHRFHNQKKKEKDRKYCRNMKILKIFRHSHTENTKIKQ